MININEELKNYQELSLGESKNFDEMENTPLSNIITSVEKEEYSESKQQPVKPEMPKIGRNEPCPCGSGKKYKNCCGR